MISYIFSLSCLTRQGKFFLTENNDYIRVVYKFETTYMIKQNTNNCFKIFIV